MPHGKLQRQKYELPLLKTLEEFGGEVKVPDLAFYEAIRQLLGITGREFDPIHAKPKWLYELQWVRYDLVQKGDMDGSKRAIWKLTDQGRARLKSEWGNYRRVSLEDSLGAQASLGRADVVYVLTKEDIQTVARRSLGRELTDPELEGVAKELPNFIDWFEAVDITISNTL